MDDKGTILVTGGCGFIGSNFVNRLEWVYPGRVVVVDALTYAGTFERIKDSIQDNAFYQKDISSAPAMDRVFDRERPWLVINFAAETHVDRSIAKPADFITTNNTGTQVLLDVSVQYGVEKFVQISTDEVYGDIKKGFPATEVSGLAPNNPYAASKAGADLIVRSYQNTYGLNALITRCTNNYGPMQNSEKFVPKMILAALQNDSLHVYGDGGNVRDWIHVDDHCEGILKAIENLDNGIVNFCGDNQITNLELTRRIIDVCKGSYSLINFVEDRKGHDYRYAVDRNLAKYLLGWEPDVDFDKGLELTAEWYAEHYLNEGGQ